MYAFGEGEKNNNKLHARHVAPHLCTLLSHSTHLCTCAHSLVCNVVFDAVCTLRCWAYGARTLVRSGRTVCRCEVCDVRSAPVATRFVVCALWPGALEASVSRLGALGCVCLCVCCYGV
jgi:hypothetical protein